jgi:hypothetical protein
MNKKIEGKFYPLQLNEWLEMCKKLKPAEKDVLYYIRTSDPYNLGIEICVSQVALDLGKNKGTVSRALKSLEKLQLIDIELVRVKVRLLGKGVLSTDNQSCVQTTQMAVTQPELSTDNQSCVQTTQMAVTQHFEAEIITEQEFQKSKIIKNNLDLIDSLEERAKPSKIEILESKNLDPLITDLEVTSVCTKEDQPEVENFSLSQDSAAPLSSAEKYKRLDAKGVSLKTPELREWASQEIGEAVKLYRKSGHIMTGGNDIDGDFAVFVASRNCPKGQRADITLGFNVIRKCEKDPRRWQEIVIWVYEWHNLKSSNPVNVTQQAINQRQSQVSQATAKYNFTFY